MKTVFLQSSYSDHNHTDIANIYLNLTIFNLIPKHKHLWHNAHMELFQYKSNITFLRFECRITENPQIKQSKQTAEQPCGTVVAVG